VSSDDGTGTALEGAWRIDAIDGRPALAEVEATLEFHADGHVAGTAGLNRFAGAWTLDGSVLTLGPLASTLMAGPPDRMEQEGRVLEILGGPLAVTLDDAALVLEGRGGRLELTRVAVTLEDTPTRRVVAGTATYRERIPPPPGAILTVRVVDVTLAEIPAPVIAEERYDLTAVPAAFELSVDPDAIGEGRSYALRAEIRDAERLRWETETVYPVLTPDAPGSPDLILVAVPANP
jgi:heat shock protein HslJ